jgi:hypothetical protein
MRDTMAVDIFGLHLFDLPARTVRVGAVALAIGVMMMSGVARAQDDEDDGKTFEERIIDNIMAGVGATNMENRGIDYRERSPLVVPPTTELPPPASTSAEIKVPNWPKDPDISRRKAAIEARKKEKKNSSPEEDARALKPSELNVGKPLNPTKRADNDPEQPGVTNNPMLSPSQLGFNGRFSDMFHGNSSESVPFKNEPTRDTLTQPPVGYQTPSPNFAYGTGPKESLNKDYNPAAGQYGDK